eukprot:Seg3021.4 transcript_id=Seg3021.4/GoldUCD/mRNA.D3Y31 product="hypothetical protein" protein_id=Seg3021.4/GoldUCD/D3Y31
MLGLLASTTVDHFGIGQNDSFMKPVENGKSMSMESELESADSDLEVFSLLPNNRKKKQMKKITNGMDGINLGPKCKACLAFLVMLSFVGVIMLVSMAALGEFQEHKLPDFQPVIQLKHDEAGGFEVHEEQIRGYRLPSGITPKLYSLALDVDLVNAKFTGKVDITVLCGKAMDKIVMHSARHIVTKAEIKATDETDKGMAGCTVVSLGEGENNSSYGFMCDIFPRLWVLFRDVCLSYESALQRFAAVMGKC